MNDYISQSNSFKIIELKSKLFGFSVAEAGQTVFESFNKAQFAGKRVFKKLYRPVKRNVSSDTFIIPVGTQASVTGFLYRKTKKNTEETQALIVYIHSGGWVMGNTDITNAICSNICNTTGAAVLAVDYRLAPKFKFPLAIEDCYQAFLWAFNGAKYWKVDPSKVYILGSSCGANIAAAVCQVARDRKGPVPAGQILIDPVLDGRLRTQSCLIYKDSPALSDKDLKNLISLYQREPKDILDPLFSPLESKDLSRMPETLILAAEYDILYDDAKIYEQSLIAADSSAKLITREKSLHGFMDYPRSERWQDYMACITEFVRGVSVKHIELLTSSERAKKSRNKIFFIG